MEKLLPAMRGYFHTGATRPIAFRRDALNRLEQGIFRWESALQSALQEDLGKSHFESYTTEIGFVLSELKDMKKHLSRWAAPQKVPSPLSVFPAKSKIYKEPYGVVLIFSPWNYPIQLTLVPLLTALAAGNCVVVKPSEHAPKSAAVLSSLLKEVFPPEYVSVVEGGPEESEALLHQKFDYIFFTGSTQVGKAVMTAAAAHLTPVTLELGGKSPCILAPDADLDLAAKRIVWGKLVNAGQTCVAPDYIWLPKQQQDSFLACLKKWIVTFYGETPLQNPQYPHIINETHFHRLLDLIDSNQVVFGGKSDSHSLRIEPTILSNVTEQDPIMGEEIFGPLLPLLPYSTLEALVLHLQQKPRPLALYLFTRSKQIERQVLPRLSFGGGCVNDTLVHLISSHLPFGGIGDSGQGAYHGKTGFDTFTHLKSVMHRGNLDISLRYPPFREEKIRLIKKIL